jgi:parallel beta-helix repeat protein
VRGRVGRTGRASALLLAGLALGGACAPGGDGAGAGSDEGIRGVPRAPEYGADVAAMSANPQCGAVLTRSVTLRADLGPCPDVGLVLGADDVTLDCDGYRIIGGVGGGVKAEDRAGLHIRNCHVEGSIELRDTIGAYVEHNTADAIDVVDGVGDTVRDNEVGGAEMTGYGVRFVDNHMPGPDAVLLVFGTAGRVSGNDIHGTIELDGTAHRIDSNDLRGGYMLVEDTRGGRIEYNRLWDSVYGVSVLDASHNRFVGNEVEDSENFGFLFWGGGGSSHNLLRDNEAEDNADVGFWLDYGSNGNVLVDNEACDNGVADLRDEAAGTVLLDNDFCVVEAP